MRIAKMLIGMMALGACDVQAQEPPGKLVFAQHCAECHADGIGHPGTQRLGWSRGEKFSVLEKRTDLNADYIKLIVRRGLLEMPAFRPSEISDADLVELDSYLAKKRPGGSR
jgi:mono/diheme cytochrome c family protein